MAPEFLSIALVLLRSEAAKNTDLSCCDTRNTVLRRQLNYGHVQEVLAEWRCGALATHVGPLAAKRHAPGDDSLLCNHRGMQATSPRPVTGVDDAPMPFPGKGSNARC